MDPRRGPILVARTPPPLEQQFAAMSVSGAAPSSYAPAPQPPVLSRRVLAYFEEQRKIGTQWPKNPYPMKYDISVYRMADAAIEKCLASVDSPDWRIREVSIRATDAAIDLLDEALRRPITEASKKACEGVTPKNMKEKWADNYVNTSLHVSDIPDFVRSNPTETRSEQTRFKIHPASKSVILSVPKTMVAEIGLRVLSFLIPGPTQSPGPVLLEDLLNRIWNLSEKIFRPEIACMIWCEKNFPGLSVVKSDGGVSYLNASSMTTALACELVRRMRSTNMNPRIVDSLVEIYVREMKSLVGSGAVVSTIEKGRTGDNIGALSW